MNAVLPSDQFADIDLSGPRFREAGDVTLDLFHRDGRVEDLWLGLQPRDFALLWRLAQRPGEPVAPSQLVAEAWRLHAEPACHSLAGHLARVRAKLESVGLAQLVRTNGAGEYFLDVPPAPNVSRAGEQRGGDGALDRGGRIGQSPG